MVLSDLGWLNGLSAIGYIIFGFTLGAFFLIKGKKLNIKLLYFTGIAQIFNSLTLNLEYACDFLAVLSTGNNLNNPNGFIGILTWIWMIPASLFLYYVAVKLIIPKKKKSLLSVIIILGTIFAIILLLDRGNSFTFVYPNNSGEELIKVQVDFTSPLGIIAAIYGTMFTIILFGFGTVYKAIQSKGVIRKKFLLLAIGLNLFNVMQTTDAFLSNAIVSFIARIFGAIGWVAVYFALREEPERRLKRVKITEEEISFNLERKICLVCKGDVSRINYMCPKCNNLYCVNCSEALSSLENMCWVCDEPFDETKPVRPYKEGETVADLKISKKDE